MSFLSSLYRTSGRGKEAPEGSNAVEGSTSIGDEGQGEREEVRQVVEARGGREGAGGRGHLL